MIGTILGGRRSEWLSSLGDIHHERVMMNLWQVSSAFELAVLASTAPPAWGQYLGIGMSELQDPYL